MGNKKILTRNRLSDQTSPYLLQHANNPVDWYPWCEEAFETAEREDKPVFLSIGYSTCHWCHVMAHESFEDPEVASLLNEYFISIKVDREERPDLDSVYMSVCQAFTGNGGWPMTIFLTPDRNPFFAGTFFPKAARYGQIGLTELLQIIHEKWMTDRSTLLKPIDEVLSYLNGRNETGGTLDEKLISKAIGIYKKNYDCLYGGFSEPSKFPAAHNLLFLMKYYERNSDQEVLQMVEKTLQQMARGGLFDHVGGGFCRYSTDRFYLVPHFEKMLYDNALLIHAYCKAYQITGNSMYCEVAERTAAYILREMTAPEGGFYCAQDADSEGCEGLFYLFEPEEVIALLGEEAGEKCLPFHKKNDTMKHSNIKWKWKTVNSGGDFMARRCSVERANKQIGSFASAKKNLIIQYQGRERSEKHLLDLIYQDILNRGVQETEIEDIDIYVKPEEQAVFYVINKKIEGQIVF